MGLKTLFIGVGSGNYTRFIPVDKLAINMGEISCNNVIKAHIATGCDWLSKVGSKSKALDNMNLLSEFGENELTDESVGKAEEYLCSVLTGKDKFKFFDDYRYYKLTRLCTPLVSLVPSSACIRNGHIRRLFFLIKYSITLLSKSADQLQPLDYGWENKSGYLLPSKCLRELPKHLYATCRCAECSKVPRRCGCKKHFTRCTTYCDCKGNAACKE